MFNIGVSFHINNVKCEFKSAKRCYWIGLINLILLAFLYGIPFILSLIYTTVGGILYIAFNGLITLAAFALFGFLYTRSYYTHYKGKPLSNLTKL